MISQDTDNLPAFQEKPGIYYIIGESEPFSQENPALSLHSIHPL